MKKTNAWIAFYELPGEPRIPRSRVAVRFYFGCHILNFDSAAQISQLHAFIEARIFFPFACGWSSTDYTFRANTNGFIADNRYFCIAQTTV